MPSPERSQRRALGGLGALVALVVLVGACSGSSPVAAPTSAASTPATSQPTATPTLGGPVTPVPTPTMRATLSAAEQEAAKAAGIEAFQRYIALGAEARGPAPSAAALDVASYATGSLLNAFEATLAGDRQAGIYWDGATDVLVTEAAVNPGGSVTIDACLTTDWTSYGRADEQPVEVEGPRAFRVSARVVETADGWRVSAAEVNEVRCLIG